uniref:Uncharacterized protein n=1 Tax=Lactuca sativa TaxID=4236 RepID=A0A9R1VDL1_LACSA|nr:hypothetical protein LSAT_V11C500255190 [Lactuca sativa]
MVSMGDMWSLANNPNFKIPTVYYYGSWYFFEDAIKKSKEITNRHAIVSDEENNSRLGKNFSSRGFQDEECMKLFFLEADHEGKTMLEEASTLGHLDSIFVLGMMVMAKGRHRKQEDLEMLNNAYRRAKGKWNFRATCSKVHLNLNREGRKHRLLYSSHPDYHKNVEYWRSSFVRLSPTRDFESYICSVRGKINERHRLCKTACIDMFEGMSPKNLKADIFICTCALHNNIEARQAVDEDHLKVIYLDGMIYNSRGLHQCDEVVLCCIIFTVVYNYLMPIWAKQFRMMGSTRVFLIAPKSCSGLLTLFIDLQRITSHSNVKIHSVK